MAKANLSVYNLGSLGVNVDSSPIHLKDGELTKSQNAMHDRLGVAGGLTNRPGLLAFNGSALAGSTLGGIGVPLPNLASSTRTIYVGASIARAGSGVLHGNQWRKSTTAFTTASSAAAAGLPSSPRGRESNAWATNADYGIGDFAPGNTYLVGQPGCSCVINNTLYYAANSYITYNNTGYTAPTIRAFDGTVDTLVATIPYNPDTGVGTVAKGVLSMITANGLIYISTFDGGTKNNGDFRGRVFQLTPQSGILIPLGATFTTTHLPYALAFHAGRLWVATNTQDTTTNGKIFFFRPGVDTAWTLDITGSSGNYCCLQSYKGVLYAGTMNAAATFAVVNARDTLGNWTNSTTATGGTATQYNAFCAMTVFNNNLYASYWNDDVTAIGKIYKYDGTTWTTAYNGSGATSIQAQGLFIDNGVLFAIGNTNWDATVTMLTTPDGSAWTDRSANFGSIDGFPAFYVVAS